MCIYIYIYIYIYIHLYNTYLAIKTIQELIERLLAESEAEATESGMLCYGMI